MKKIITSLLLLTILNVKSQTISLDTSFGTNGFTSIPLVGEGDDLQIQISQDNKILATGKDLPISTSINPNKVYKLNLDGTLDTSFGNLGTLILPNYSGDFKAVLQGSDKFLIVFQSVSSTAPNFRSILRYNSNGTLDTSFNGNGYKIENTNTIQEVCESINIQTDGKILVSGEYKNGSTKKLYLMRYVDQNLSTTAFENNSLKIANPINETLNIITENEVHNVSIFGTDGKLIIKTNEKNINTSKLSKGIYIVIVEFKNEEKKHSAKIIKQ